MQSGHYSVAIVGAGPYGLALAAQLKASNSTVIQFGRPMGFWQENVPIGTRLLSGPGSCALGGDGLCCNAYAADMRKTLPVAFSGEEFLAYGLWFQRRACPAPDPRTIVNVSYNRGRYELRTDDSAEVTADHVVIAVGLRPFVNRPSQFAALPERLFLHTSDLHDLSRFSGKRVAVIGGGQSAVDCAALLSEANASVDLIVRSAQIPWIGSDRIPTLPQRKPNFKSKLRRLVRETLSEPATFQRFPLSLRSRVLNRIVRPGPDRKLSLRLGKVRFALGRTISRAAINDGEIELELDDESTRTVDYVVCGTGYRVAVSALDFLAPQLRGRIRTVRGYPALNGKMESSVRGLFFLGAAAALSFGPEMWLVRKAPWAATTVCRAIMAGSRAAIADTMKANAEVATS